MTLNVGLLLKHPGESSYAKYRRFLISNNNISFRNIKRELHEYLTSKKIKLPQYNSFLALADYAAQLENSFIDANSLKINKPIKNLQKRYRPLKCCNTCAAIGFHCDLFDLPGLDLCPIHEEKLVKNCKLCGNPWPTAASLPLRYCSVCGINLKFQDIKKNLFAHIDIYQKICEFQLFLQVEQGKFADNFYILDHQLGFKYSKHLNDRHSPFYGRFLIKNYVKDSEQKENFLGYAIKEFSFVKETYTIERVDKPRYQTNSPLAKEIRSKVIHKTLSKFHRIFDKGGHIIGQCDTSSGSKIGCLSCETFKSWTSVIINKYNSDQDLIKYKELRNLLIAKTLTSSHIHLSLYIDKYNGEGYYINIPSEMSEKIYEDELWTLAIYVYYFFSKVAAERGKNSEIQLYDFHKILSSLPKAKKLCPYVIRLIGNNLVLYFTKDLFTDEKNFYSDIEKLLFRAFD